MELVIPLAEGSHDDIYQLADGSEPVRAPDPKPCPNCGQIMLGGAVLCTSCGYDDRTGLRAQTSAVAGPVTYQGPRCSNCGYELAGLRSSKCPECGTRNRPGSRREAAEREAKEFVRQEYIRPAIYLAVGLASHAILLAATASTTSIIALPLVLAIQTVGGVIAFYILSALVWGFDAPIGLISIRLAGIFALNNIVQALLARTGVEAIAWGGGALVTYGLIMKEFDIDDWREVWWMMVTMKVVGVIGIVLVASIM